MNCTNERHRHSSEKIEDGISRCKDSGAGIDMNDKNNMLLIT